MKYCCFIWFLLFSWFWCFIFEYLMKVNGEGDMPLGKIIFPLQLLQGSSSRGRLKSTFNWEKAGLLQWEREGQESLAVQGYHFYPSTTIYYYSKSYDFITPNHCPNIHKRSISIYFLQTVPQNTGLTFSYKFIVATKS